MELPPPPPSPPPSAPPSSPPPTYAVPLGHTPFSWRADASVAPQSERPPPVVLLTPPKAAERRSPAASPLHAVRFCALLSYDGTDFDGWMGGDNSLQPALERRIAAIVRHGVEVVASGRTDAGVHARAQVVHFDASAAAEDGLLRALRHGLPDAVTVYALARAPSGFHSRQSCVGKRYTYRVLVGGAPAPWERRHCWEREGAPLDAARMRAAAALLLGSHDFSAFGFIDESGKSCADPRGPVRELRRLDVLEEQTAGQQRLLLVVEADRFLMRMARMISGTLVEVGSGRLSVADFGALLGAARRTPAVVTAPAAGLSLDAVFYDDDHAVSVLRDAARSGGGAPQAREIPGWPSVADVGHKYVS